MAAQMDIHTYTHTHTHGLSEIDRIEDAEHRA